MEEGYTRFVRAIDANLTRLAVLCGASWPRIGVQIDPLLEKLRNERDPARMIALVNRLRRVFARTPAAYAVQQLFRDAMQGERDPVVESVPPSGQRPAPARHFERRAARNVRYKLETPDFPAVEPAGAPAFEPGADAAEPALFFVLEGTAVKANRIPANGNASLILRDGRPVENALLTLNAPAVEAARKRDLDITLFVSCSGSVQLVSEPSVIAKFKDGRLVSKVVFRLNAGASGGRTPLHVDYHVQGVLVHQSEIEIEVIDAAGGALPPPGATPLRALPSQFLATAATAFAIPPQRIRLSLTFANGFLAIYLTDTLAGQINFEKQYIAQGIEKAMLDGLLHGIRNDLQPMYSDVQVWGEFDGSGEGAASVAEVAAALQRASEAVALAGSRLYRTLHDDPGLRPAMEYIDAANDGCVLSVTTDILFLPWEIVYPPHRAANPTAADRAADPVITQQFWGARFAIETDQRGDFAYVKLQRTHAEGGARISVNVNDKIQGLSADPARQPATIHQSWAGTLQGRNLLAGIQNTCGTIRNTLRAPAAASLIYIYCHGKSADVVAGVDATLEVADGCKVQPSDVHDGPQFPGAPIVFVNSCEAGAISPLVFDQFLREFRNRGALGMIATTFQVPATFGAVYAQEVIDAYIRRRGSLAAELLILRVKHLAKMNPVPLLYTLQCHLDLPFPLP
ncbi:MAG: hypothetical protein JWR65_2100 [Massilia sp.]|nr:hypothetical protein [Massilia sp.]